METMAPKAAAAAAAAGGAMRVSCCRGAGTGAGGNVAVGFERCE